MRRPFWWVYFAVVAFITVGVPASAADEGSRGANGKPLALERSIPLPHLKGGTNHLAADAKRGRFFVTAPGEKRVFVVDLKAGKVLRVLTDVPASAAAFLPDLDQLCLSGGGGVTFYDGDSFAEIGKVDLHSAVDELHYNQQEKRLYAGVMDPDKAGIAVIDARGRKLLSVLKLPAKPQGFAVEEKGPHIYANTPGAKQVTVLDRKQSSVVAEWKLSEAQSNYPIALDESNGRLFVGCRRPARLVVLDIATGKNLTGIEAGGDADDMSFDPAGRRIYLACGTGVVTTIQQVDANHYRKLPDTPTADGARNSLFVPELRRFNLAVPRQGDQPAELRVYIPRK